MFERARIAVVVPAYQCEARVGRVLRTLPGFVDLAVLVDDASTDRTNELARATRASASRPSLRIEVLRHERNRGVGAAIATGYRAALELGADVIAVMAGDGQMHPDDLEALVAPVVRDECDYAKGNRLAHAGVLRAMPATRLAGNVALSLLTRLATGLTHVSDSQCGYTAVHRRVLRVLDPAHMWTRYGYPNHLLGALAREGFRVRDVTVRAVYEGERSGVRLRDALVTVPTILLHVARARVREGDRWGRGFAHEAASAQGGPAQADPAKRGFVSLGAFAGAQVRE